MTGEHVATQDLDIRQDMSENEQSIFHALLHPDDMYDATGTYWADMPLGKRLKFVTAVDKKEAHEEASYFWAMFKKDPLEPMRHYLQDVKFSLVSSVTGWAVATVSSKDAVIMFVGLLMLTAAWGVTQNGWVICYVWALFFYGIGVGGEYPMTATAGMENAVGSGKVSTKERPSAPWPKGHERFLDWTYRVSFAIPAVGTLWLVYFRYYKMKSASKQLMLSKKKSKVTGYDVQSLKLTFTYFGPRLIATAGAWFANDVFFYGNKLFQNEFIKVITPNNNSVMTGWLYNLINVGVSLCGYYLASLLIDNKLYGRKWMMIVGFFADFILFVIPALSTSSTTRSPRTSTLSRPCTSYPPSSPVRTQQRHFLRSLPRSFPTSGPRNWPTGF
ncbi:hypothetical protein SNOG_04294, partial [Parastagonospora nodorum SN15]